MKNRELAKRYLKKISSVLFMKNRNTEELASIALMPMALWTENNKMIKCISGVKTHYINLEFQNLFKLKKLRL